MCMYDYPCDYPVKAIGLANSEFEDAVLAIVGKHVEKIDKEQISKRTSRHAKYVSITISIIAESRKQLEALYQDLQDHELVLVVL